MVDPDWPERTNQLVVTTPSGMKLTLEPRGWDDEGRQLWRQVKP